MRLYWLTSLSLQNVGISCVKMWCLDMHTGSPNGGAGAVSGDGEFVVLGLPVFLRGLNISFDI